FEANDGFLSTILQIIGADELSTGTKQAAAIYFKNRVSRAWSASQHALDNHAPISESDRAAAKENILKFIYATPHTIKVQLTSCLGVILNFDYPDKWAQFDGQLKELLSAQDPQMVYTGLLALRELVRLYRYSQTKRTVIDAVARDLFPRVQAVVDDAIGSDDELAMRMVWAAFKTYYAAIQVALPVALQEPGSLVAWGTSFIKMMEKPVAFDRSLVDEDTAKEPVWKAKKWAFRSVNRLYSRFGNPATLAPSQKRYKTFAKVFTANFLPQIMQAYFKQIDGY
ncbi:Nonsense-mediated mRNA decay protein 5, partial [Linderina pennispora]